MKSSRSTMSYVNDKSIGGLFLQYLLLIAVMIVLGFFVREVLYLWLAFPLNNLFVAAVSVILIGAAFTLRGKSTARTVFAIGCYCLLAIRIWTYFFLERKFEKYYFPVPADNDFSSVKNCLLWPFLFESIVLFGFFGLALVVLHQFMRKNVAFSRRWLALCGGIIGGIFVITAVAIYVQPALDSLVTIFYPLANVSRSLIAIAGLGLPLYWLWKTRSTSKK